MTYIPKVCVGAKVHPLGKSRPIATVVSDLGGAWMVVIDGTVSAPEIWMKSETARWLVPFEEVI